MIPKAAARLAVYRVTMRKLLVLLWPLILLVLACTNDPELAAPDGTAGATAPEAGNGGAAVTPAGSGGTGGKPPADGGAAGESELGQAGSPEAGGDAGAAGAAGSPEAGGSAELAGSGGAAVTAGAGGQGGAATAPAPRAHWGSCDPTQVWACDGLDEMCLTYQESLSVAPRPICQIACQGDVTIAHCAQAGGVCYGGPIAGCVPHNPTP